MLTKILGVILVGLMLIAGACSASAPKTAQIKVQLVGTDQTPYWQPNSVSVSVGGTVVWMNTSNDQRSVISDQGLFNQTVAPGGSFQYVFKTAGTFTFHDDPNIDTNTIVVK